MSFFVFWKDFIGLNTVFVFKNRIWNWNKTSFSFIPIRYCICDYKMISINLKKMFLSDNQYLL